MSGGVYHTAGLGPGIRAAVNSRLEETSFRAGMTAAVIAGAVAVAVAGLLMLLSGSAPASVPGTHVVVMPTIEAPAASAAAVHGAPTSGRHSVAASLPSAVPVVPSAASGAGQSAATPGQPTSGWSTAGSGQRGYPAFGHGRWRRHGTGWYGTGSGSGFSWPGGEAGGGTDGEAGGGTGGGTAYGGWPSGPR